MGGIIGIDPSSWDRNVASERQEEGNANNSMSHEKPGESTKIRIMKREDVDSGGGD